MPSVDQETQQIISTYQQIYNLIFKYGVFIVLGALSFVVILSLKPTSYANSDDITLLNTQSSTVSMLVHSGDAYIAKGITLAPEVDAAPLDISILQWFVDISPEAQMWFGALATYKWILLPISINLTPHDDGLTKEHFENEGYDPADLDTYIQNTILTYPVKNIQATLYQYKQNTLEENIQIADSLGADFRTATIPMDNAKVLPETTTLTSHFWLQCLGNRHLTNFFCYKNTELFVLRIPYISFDNKIEELYTLMGDIVNTPYKTKACDNLQYAFSKKAESSRDRELVFGLCWPKYVRAYHRIVDFATVTYELQWISNAKLYSDKDINIFKLLSLQQKIYHNTLQKNYDVGTIEAYLSFVQDLLTKRTDIDKIYKDMIYIYNNTYLQDALTQIAILNNNTKAMLRLTDVVRNINEWSLQLQRMVSNPALLTYVDANKWSSTSQPNLVTFQDLFASKFTTFDSFIVTSQKVDNDTLSAQVEGYFLVDSNGQERKVLFVGDYLFENETFTLMSASFPQSTYLESSLNRLINQNTMEIDIPFVYEFIKNNIDYASVRVWVCDIVTARVDLQSCDGEIGVYEDDAGLRITIWFDEYKITRVEANNASITAKLNNSIQNVITTQNNIWVIVEQIIKTAQPTEIPTNTDTQTGSSVDTNQFTLISKFKQFLDVTPDSINLNWGKYIVEFELANITFVAAVDIANNYKIFPLGIQKGDQVVRINNLSLNLTNASLTEINLFKANPWEYIKKVDPATYEITYPEDNK